MAGQRVVIDFRKWKMDVVGGILDGLVRRAHRVVMMVGPVMMVVMMMGSRCPHGVRSHGQWKADRASGTEGDSPLDHQEECGEDS